MFEVKTKTSLPHELLRREVLNLGCGRKHVEGAINLDMTRATNPDVLATFEEIHRVCRDGAIVRVAVPHFSCANAYTDPTHKRTFGYFSLDNLTEEGEFSFYTSARFRVRHRQIIFWPTLFNKLVWRLANRYPMWYELRWAWVFPALFLSFELEVVKGESEA